MLMCCLPALVMGVLQKHLQEGRRGPVGARQKEWEMRGNSPETRRNPDDEHFTYLNHYNTTLNKCFYLPSKHIVVWQDLVNATSTVHRDLVDPNENKTYGEFVATWTMVNTQWSPVSVHRCYVQEETCSSEREWQELIKAIHGRMICA